MSVITIFRKNHAEIIVTFPYNPRLVEKVKTIPGHRWHPVEIGKTKGPLDSLALKGGDSDKIFSVEGMWLKLEYSKYFGYHHKFRGISELVQ